MQLTVQRRLAAQIGKCSQNRVKFTSENLPDIKESISSPAYPEEKEKVAISLEEVIHWYLAQILKGSVVIDAPPALAEEIEDFQISIDADREQGKEPALWLSAHVVFKLKGNIDKDRALRAVELSMKKYCSVSATLEKSGTKITYEVKVNE